MLIARIEEDTFLFDIPDVLREMVVDLARQLHEQIDSDNPSLQRLFPTAYSNDPEKDAGYQILARGELVDGRRTSLTTVMETVDDDQIDGETLEAWMRVVNDLRLVMGTHLDISESDDWAPAPEQEISYAVYHSLSTLLHHIVEAQF